MSIDWAELESAKNISDFNVSVVENDIHKFYKNGITGTTIIIEELKSKWDRRQIRQVYRNLLSLNSPFADKNDSFAVNITSNENLLKDYLIFKI